MTGSSPLSPRCCAEVHSDHGWRFRRCTRAGTIEEGGKPYCHQHAPSVVARKKDEYREKEERRVAQLQADREVAKCRNEVVYAAKAAVQDPAPWDGVISAVRRLIAAEAAKESLRG